MILKYTYINNKMHKGMKKISGLWFSGLSTMVIVFVSLVSQAQTGTVVDEVVAVVGSKPVLLSDIENQYLQYRAQKIGRAHV